MGVISSLFVFVNEHTEGGTSWSTRSTKTNKCQDDKKLGQNAPCFLTEVWLKRLPDDTAITCEEFLSKIFV